MSSGMQAWNVFFLFMKYGRSPKGDGVVLDGQYFPHKAAVTRTKMAAPRPRSIDYSLAGVEIGLMLLLYKFVDIV